MTFQAPTNWPQWDFEQNPFDIHISVTSSHNCDTIVVNLADNIVVFLTRFQCLIVVTDQFHPEICPPPFLSACHLWYSSPQSHDRHSSLGPIIIFPVVTFVNHRTDAQSHPNKSWQMVYERQSFFSFYIVCKLIIPTYNEISNSEGISINVILVYLFMVVCANAYKLFIYLAILII